MKKILAILVLAVISMNVSAQSEQLMKKWGMVISAIAKVESSGNPKAVSSDGLYVGYLQISEILVKQCNILAGYNKYTPKDRYSKEKSIAMFIDYQEEYNPEGNLEKAIRLWNSGDLKCMTRKAKTERYYQRVMKRYNEIAELR